MTIRMLQAWSGYPQQSIVTLAAEEEARLVGLGLATADLDGEAEGLEPVMAKKSLTGMLSFFAAGKYIPAKNSAGSIRVAVIGDSITQADGTADSFAMGNSWFEYLCFLSNGRLRRVRNAGIGGNTSAQMLARIDADVIAFAPDICFISAGINDVGQSISTATTMSNVDQMCAKLTKAGIEPVLLMLSPRSPYLPNIDLLNLHIQKYAALNGFRIVNPWRKLTDSNAGWLPGMAGNEGGVYVHPTAVAQRIAAQDLVTQITMPDAAPMLPRANSDSNGLVSNCLFMTDTNADGMPDGWSTYGAAIVASLVAGTGEVPGKWFKVDFTNITGLAVIEKQVPLGGSVAGDKLLFAFRFKTTLEVGGARVAMRVSFNGANTHCQPMWSLTTDLEGVVQAETVVPAGTTSMTLQIIPNTVGASASGSVQVAQMQIYNLTKLGLA